MDYVTIDYVYLTLYEKYVYNRSTDSTSSTERTIILDILNDIKSMYKDALMSFDQDMDNHYKQSLEDKYE